jgi:hypothetical protein
MAFQFASRKRRNARRYILQKPRGVIHPRVQAVGPEHFGILCVDCAKGRSKIMLADFYGRVLIEPTTVTHDRFGLDAAAKSVRDAAARHVLKDLIVVIERTGSSSVPAPQRLPARLHSRQVDQVFVSSNQKLSVPSHRWPAMVSVESNQDLFVSGPQH